MSHESIQIASAESVSDPDVRESNAHQPPVVLLVQPNTDIREMYSEYLGLNGFTVLPVADGEEASRLLPRADAIVTDLLIPKVDGVDLLHHVHDHGAMATIVLTAAVFPSDRAHAKAAGCDAFLPMPCLPEKLLRTVRWLLRHRRPFIQRRATLSPMSRREPRLA